MDHNLQRIFPRSAERTNCDFPRNFSCCNHSHPTPPFFTYPHTTPSTHYFLTLEILEMNVDYLISDAILTSRRVVKFGQTLFFYFGRRNGFFYHITNFFYVHVSWFIFMWRLLRASGDTWCLSRTQTNWTLQP